MKLLNLVLIFVFVELIILENVWGLSPPIRDPATESLNEKNETSVSAFIPEHVAENETSVASVAPEVATKNKTHKVAASMGGGGFSPEEEEDDEPDNTYNTYTTYDPRNPYGAGWCCRTASQAYYDSRCRTDLNYYYFCIPTTYYANQQQPGYNYNGQQQPGYTYYTQQQPGYNYNNQQQPGYNYNGQQPLYSFTRPQQAP